MADLLVSATPATALARPVTSRERILDAFLRGRKPATLRAYAAALDAFALFCGQERGDAIDSFLGGDVADAHVLALSWQDSMTVGGLSPATINHRLAVLRTCVKLAHSLGMVHWQLTVSGPAAERYRDTRGPGKDTVTQMLALAASVDGPIGARDTAILALLYVLALRRNEVAGLDREHVDLAGARVWILGKGRGDREARTIPPFVARVLAAWLATRGDHPGPLFTGMAQGNHVRTRIDGSSIYRVVQAYGKMLGVKVRPHGLRHAAITEALDRTGGDVRKVQQFSRHKKIETLMIYDDARQDRAGEVASILGEDL